MQERPAQGPAEPQGRDHRTLAARLAAYHDGALPARRMRAIATHVAGCAWCQARLAQFARADAALRAAPQPVPPPAVRLGLARRIAAHRVPASARIPFPTTREDRIPMSSPSPRERAGTAQPRVVVASLVTVLIIALAFFVFHNGSVGKPGAGQGTAAPAPPTPTSGPRGANDVVAYLGSDHHLHVVTATGHDTTGPVLPETAIIDGTDNIYSPTPLAGASGDERYIGYIASSGGFGTGSVNIYDIATQKVTAISAHANALYFAPTGTHFVANVATGQEIPSPSLQLTIGDAATGTARTLPIMAHGSPVTVDRILGWSDPDHIIVMAQPSSTGASAAAALTVPLTARIPASQPSSSGPTNLVLGKVDATTGQMTSITTLFLNPVVEPILSGDGTKVWLAPTYWTPTTTVIDLATGTSHDLPGIAGAFAGQLHHLDNAGFTQSGNWATHVAPILGTHVLFVSLSAQSTPNEDPKDVVQQNAGVWRVDLDADTATRIDQGHYPLAFGPDGSGLFVCDVPPFQPSFINSGFVTGPTLGFLSPDTAAGKVTTLTTQMVTYFGVVTP